MKIDLPMTHADPAKGRRALDAYRHAQDAGLSLSQFAVLCVRLRFLGLEAPGVTWTAPDEMHFHSGIKDPKVIRAADRALLDLGILSVAEAARSYRVTRYRLHLDRLAAMAAERVAAFEATKQPAKRNGRPPKVAGEFPLSVSESDRGIPPKWPGKFPPELITGSEDIQSFSSPTDNASARAPTPSSSIEPEGSSADEAKQPRSGRPPKQWRCPRTRWMVPTQVTPAAWAAVVDRIPLTRGKIAEKALRSLTQDAYDAMKDGRDPSVVLTNAARCGLARANADRFPGWPETLGQQPPDAIAGTLMWRCPVFDGCVDAMRAAVRSLLAQGYDLNGIEQIAEAVERERPDDPVASLVATVRHYFEPDAQAAEDFRADDEGGRDTQARFYPAFRDIPA